MSDSNHIEPPLVGYTHEAHNAETRRLRAIATSIASMFYSSWVINIEANTLEELDAPDYAQCIADVGKTDARKALHMFVDDFLDDESDRDEVRAFLDLNTLPARVDNERVISVDCHGKKAGWVRLAIMPVRYNGDAIKEYVLGARGMDAFHREEMRVKKALEDAYEAANRASNAKSNFLSSMSHDIRTPMNAIIGMTAIAGTHLDDPERVADCLQKITVSSKHLLGLINEVLDMSKIESGKLDLNIEEFDLSRLVDNLLSMCKPEIEAHHHDLTINIVDIEHELVVGDPQRIQQAFMNLMSNAVKYTPDGGHIRLTISEKPTNDRHTGCFEFVFEDDGIGMAPEFQEHLFEPFSRAYDSRVTSQQGTGLGMAITRNIVHMMNGSIECVSAPGEGTTFTVTIFLQLQEQSGAEDLSSFAELPVLVADDDQLSCETAVGLLDELGMLGEWVLTGAEAVERVVARHKRADDYFAVILDWKMPEMDGVATTRAIRAAVGEDVPIIIISAYDWTDIELEARAAGANAFISKPLFKSRVVHLFKVIANKGGQQPVEKAPIDSVIESDFSGHRVLLVEDNVLNAEIAAEILKMAGLEVDFAVDGREAFETMEKCPDDYYDMVFMDIQMPVMNGYESTRAIRAVNREYLKKVPIVAMTADAFAEDVEAARDVGMNEHIAKPIDFKRLVKVLETWLGN